MSQQITVTITVPSLDDEDIRRAIIFQAVRQILGLSTEDLGEDPYTGEPVVINHDALFQSMRANAAEITKGLVKGAVESRVPAIVDEVLAQEFQPFTRWGEKEGPPTTIRRMIGEFARGWLTEATDARGQTGYSNDAKRPRLHWLIAQSVEEVFKREFGDEVKKAAAEVKAGLVARVGGQITEAVANILNLSK